MNTNMKNRAKRTIAGFLAALTVITATAPLFTCAAEITEDEQQQRQCDQEYTTQDWCIPETRTSDKKTPCGDQPSGAFLLPDHQRLQGGETASTGKKLTGTSNAGQLQNAQLTKSIKYFPKKCSACPESD